MALLCRKHRTRTGRPAACPPVSLPVPARRGRILARAARGADRTLTCMTTDTAGRLIGSLLHGSEMLDMLGHDRPDEASIPDTAIVVRRAAAEISARLGAPRDIPGWGPGA